jgi:DNA-binding NarL/FixJ family response regulator
MSIKVLVADDHEVLRQGVASLLRETDIKIVAEADTVERTVQLVKKHHPDVVLLDVRMDDDGLSALERIRDEQPDARVVMLSMFDNPTYIARAAAWGASDYLLKGASRHELISAITAAARGQPPAKHGEFKRISDALAANGEEDEIDDVPLTKRELQVLRHLAFGLSNREIGLSLKISVETVKEHVQNLVRKLGFSDRTEAAVWATRKGLV